MVDAYLQGGLLWIITPEVHSPKSNNSTGLTSGGDILLVELGGCSLSHGKREHVPLALGGLLESQEDVCGGLHHSGTIQSGHHLEAVP